MIARCSFAREPWCASTSSSPASLVERAARRSARRRLLTKSSVERCARMSSTRRGWIAGQIERFGARSGGAAGSSGSGLPRLAHVLDRHLDAHARARRRCRRRSRRAAAATRPSPLARRAAAQQARHLVERPLRRREPDALQRRVRLGAALPAAPARGTGARRACPRPARGSRRRSPCRPSRAGARAEVSSRNSDSGVVMRTSGGVRAMRARSAAACPPSARATVGIDGARRAAPAAAVMPARGARRLRSTSVASGLQRRDIEHATARRASGSGEKISLSGRRGTPRASCPSRSARALARSAGRGTICGRRSGRAPGARTSVWRARPRRPRPRVREGSRPPLHNHRGRHRGTVGLPTSCQRRVK
jgi:hypothetical protein